MIDDIDSTSSTLRLLVYQALKTWNVNGLLKLLSDEDFIVRTGAAKELHRRGGGKEVFDEIYKLSYSNKPSEREIAIFTLGQFGTPSMPYKNDALSLLIKCVTDSDEGVRSAAIAALGHSFCEGLPSEAQTAIQFSVNDPEPSVRVSLAFALGRASDVVAARNTLKVMLNDQNEEVRSYAQCSLELLEGEV